MSRRFVYLASTAVMVAEITAGGLMDLFQVSYFVTEVRSLGYPAYILYIVGLWKLLAVVPLIWSALPRLREWAYAGVFFEMFGAAESHVLSDQALSRCLVPLSFAAITVVSWWAQPQEGSPAAPAGL